MAVLSLYSGIDTFHQQRKGIKRTWEDSEEDEPKRSPDQIVPQFSRVEKKARTEFPFSNLMRSMAAKYQPQPQTSPVYNPSVLSLLAPINNPYSRLMAAMADLSQPTKNVQEEVAKHPTNNQPLDLTKPTDEKDIDVVSEDEEQEAAPVQTWSPSQVSKFVKTIEGCEDYALIFEAENISGTKLSLLSVYHLIQLLGIPLAQSVKIVSKVRELAK